MNIKKILFALSSVAIMTLASCGGSGFKHTTSKYLKAYHVDLNHDGIIAPFDNPLTGEHFEEDNLTWAEAYDNLIIEANSMAELNEIANNLNIDKNEPRRTSLARYEILHEAEELAMSTGSILPLYNYGDPYILKTNVNGVYTVNLGYKFLDKLCYNDGTSSKDFGVCVGTKGETFDPASNSDASTANIMVQFLIGAKRYVQGEEVEEGRGIYEAKLVDGVCDVKKKLVTSDMTGKDPSEYVDINNCPDIQDGIDNGGENATDYEGTARYTITMKKGAVWNNGTEILAEDFIYEWNRASSGVYNGQAFGMWCDMFDMIRGYKVWNLIGQQTSNNPEEWDEDTKETWNNTDPKAGTVLTKAEKRQYMEVFDGYSNKAGTVAPLGCAGGMAGVMVDPNNNKSFTVQLINDCDYFEDLLAFLPFMPVAKRNIMLPADADAEYERTHICEESGDWWLNNKEGDYLTNGPLEIDGPIDNVDSGQIKLTKATKFTPKLEPALVDDTTVDSLTCKFIDKESAAYDSYKSNVIQFTDRFPSSIVDELSKKPDWHTALKLGLFYYGFNVNDNTFDMKNEGQSEEEIRQGERNRENLRKALIFLINKDDIAVNVAKQGSTAANGYVSDGIMENCVPIKQTINENPSIASPLGLDWVYVAETDEDGNVVAKNWHERNKDMYSYLSSENYEYNEHIMSNRCAGGFYETVYEDETDEETVMRNNTDKAIQFAKEAGVNYDEKTGKFTNFPRLSFSTNNGTGLEDIAERMQAYLDLWGIDVSISTQEWNSFLAARRL
ncbi:MAG: ABC transporter substrate-binding protein [Bacilli bacterium]|nr:ABC transporter substrate-binding protein [Bacilli bacterium]